MAYSERTNNLAAETVSELTADALVQTCGSRQKRIAIAGIQRIHLSALSRAAWVCTVTGGGDRIRICTHHANGFGKPPSHDPAGFSGLVKELVKRRSRLDPPCLLTSGSAFWRMLFYVIGGTLAASVVCMAMLMLTGGGDSIRGRDLIKLGAGVVFLIAVVFPLHRLSKQTSFTAKGPIPLIDAVG